MYSIDTSDSIRLHASFHVRRWELPYSQRCAVVRHAGGDAAGREKAAAESSRFEQIVEVTFLIGIR